MLTQARLTFGRQQKLLEDGWTTRAKFDEAQQALLTAQAQVDSAQAQLRIAQDQLSYTDLVRRCPGCGYRGRRRTGRSGPCRADDRAARASGRTRRRLRRARAAHPDGPARPRGRDRPHRRPAGEGHRPRARGGAPGGCRHPNVPGQGRHHRSARGHAAGLHRHRQHQARRASRRGGSGERAHRGERTPGRVGGRSAESDRVAAQRGRPAVRSGERRHLAGTGNGRRSWSPPACRRCTRARRSACWEPRS